jgi:hypothetical protein
MPGPAYVNRICRVAREKKPPDRAVRGLRAAEDAR